MNAAERARLEYLRELPRMEIEANISARMKSAEYANAFNLAYELREIKAARERAWFQNFLLPYIKAAKRNSAAVAEARG